MIVNKDILKLKSKITVKRDHFLTTFEVLEKRAKCLTEQRDRHRMVESEK